MRKSIAATQGWMPVAAVALLSACSPPAETVVANGTEGGAMQPDAAAQGEAITENRENASAVAPSRYVGRWAATPELCKDGAWKFAEMDLSTAGEVSCDFHRVREVPGGYDADAVCLAEGSRSDETIQLRFPESAGGMTVTSKTFRGVGLERCDQPGK